MKKERIIKFAKEHGYENIEYLGKWQDYDVYEPIFDEENVSFIGLPLVILVKNSIIRMSTAEEAVAQLNESSN